MGRFWRLRVWPIGPTWRGYLAPSFREYQRFDQWLQLSYPPPKYLLHTVVEHRPYLSWLSGGNTASQTTWTVGIYGPQFCNYWLDAIKHGRRGVWKSISRCSNFHRNRRNFTESYKSLKQTWFWEISLCHIWNAVQIGLNIWHHFLSYENVEPLPNYIVSKIENTPPIEKFSKIKNKKNGNYFWQVVYNLHRFKRQVH